MTDTPLQTQLAHTTEAVKVAQYLAMLSIRQDAWAEIAGVVRTFMGADLVAFGERADNGTIGIHHWTGDESWCESLFDGAKVSEAVGEVLDSGFLSTRTVEDPMPFSLVFLPLAQQRRTSAVMIIGRRGGEPPPNYQLDIYLSLSSVVSGVLARLVTEKHTAHLNDVLRSVRDVNRLIARETDARCLLQAACNLLVEHGRYRMAWGGLLDGKRVSSVAAAGGNGGGAVLRECLEGGRLTNCYKEAISTGGVVVVDDPATFCAGCPMEAVAHRHATMAFPVRHQETTYGVLVVTTNPDESPDSEEKNILGEMCGDIAVGLATMQNEIARRQAEADTVLANKELSGEIVARNRAESALAEREVKIRALLEESEQGRRALLSILEDARMAEDEVRKLNAELEERIEERTCDLAAANKELEAFSYSVSHDLRAPLRHVGGFVQLLQVHAQALNDDKITRYVGIIAEAARKMGQLIDDLLSFSRTGRALMRLEPVDLSEMVQECRKDLESEIQGRIIEWKVEVLPVVMADRALMRQVFANLLGNAVKYSRKQEVAKVAVSSTVKDGEVSVCVRDNGAGFDMQYANKLFGVFQRLHSEAEFEGTGIGLANVRRIILRHGGRTWAEGEVGKGAAFYFTLPEKGE